MGTAWSFRSSTEYKAVDHTELRYRLADKEDKLAEFELLDQNNAIAPMKVW